MWFVPHWRLFMTDSLVKVSMHAPDWSSVCVLRCGLRLAHGTLSRALYSCNTSCAPQPPHIAIPAAPFQPHSKTRLGTRGRARRYPICIDPIIHTNIHTYKNRIFVVPYSVDYRRLVSWRGCLSMHGSL